LIEKIFAHFGDHPARSISILTGLILAVYCGFKWNNLSYVVVGFLFLVLFASIFFETDAWKSIPLSCLFLAGALIWIHFFIPTSVGIFIVKHLDWKISKDTHDGFFYCGVLAGIAGFVIPALTKK
jgi:signal transduction histidine kinase